MNFSASDLFLKTIFALSFNTGKLAGHDDINIRVEDTKDEQSLTTNVLADTDEENAAQDEEQREEGEEKA